MKNNSGTCGIYKITRKDTGQLYIGLSENIEKRWYNHIHRPALKHSYIDRAIKKYGANRFNLEIIEELPNDRALLMEREEYWVAHYNTYEDDFHYNLTPGGDFNPMKAPDIAAKISGENNPMFGKKLPEETRERMSKAHSGKNHYMYGKKHSEETRKKISEALKGKKLSKEHRKKISKARSGKKHLEDAKKKISEAQNTTGFFRVCKHKGPRYKQGFTYAYQYYGDDKKQHSITSVSLEKLEKKVKAKGLEWFKLEK